VVASSTRFAVRTVERARNVHYQERLLAPREHVLSNSARWAHWPSPSLSLTTFGCAASRLAGFIADKRASSSPAILPSHTESNTSIPLSWVSLLIVIEEEATMLLGVVAD
jgi:hypothetical protein